MQKSLNVYRTLKTALAQCKGKPILAITHYKGDGISEELFITLRNEFLTTISVIDPETTSIKGATITVYKITETND